MRTRVQKGELGAVLGKHTVSFLAPPAGSAKQSRLPASLSQPQLAELSSRRAEAKQLDQVEIVVVINGDNVHDFELK